LGASSGIGVLHSYFENRFARVVQPRALHTGIRKRAPQLLSRGSGVGAAGRAAVARAWRRRAAGSFRAAERVRLRRAAGHWIETPSRCRLLEAKSKIRRR